VRARDIVVPFPAVRAETQVIEAARLLASQDLPGLVVVDDRNRPRTILPGTEVLRMAVPLYCQADPALARVVDEQGADIFVHQLGNRTVAQALPAQRPELPVVDGDATALEMAALMARSRSPLVAVVDDDGALLGAVTLDALLDRVLVP
jgi:predicted transcriptional regulator